jgi:hypothetical protein
MAPTEELQTIASRLREICDALESPELDAEAASGLVDECAQLAAQAANSVEQAFRYENVR